MVQVAPVHRESPSLFFLVMLLNGMGEYRGSVTVSGGKLTATVAARDALAIHTGAKGTGSGSGGGGGGTASVSFAETVTTVLGENIFLVGSLSQLGAWDPNSAVRLFLFSNGYIDPIYTL